MKKRGILLWIISLICPIIGIILFIIFRNDKDKKKSVLRGTILGVCVYAVIMLYIATHSTDYLNRDLERWQRDVRAGNTVVTVIGASYCEHCQEYKPVITALANKHHIDLYFYEIDTLSEEDSNTLTSSFETTFEGRVPYTFIMSDGLFIDSYEGYQSQAEISAFLLQYGIIKN